MGIDIASRRPLPMSDQAFFDAPSLSPFQFRLPPPIA
jgi:hypothetical protein